MGSVLCSYNPESTKDNEFIDNEEIKTKNNPSKFYFFMEEDLNTKVFYTNTPSKEFTGIYL